MAQAVSPDARVVYVDNDPIALAHGRALLADNSSTVAAAADLLEPDAVLTASEAGGFLDLSRPAGLILNAVLHHVLDAENPHGAFARYKELLVPGSYLLLTHFSNVRRCCCARSAAASCAAGYPLDISELLYLGGLARKP
jgi:SAM-dependent methyltransferase